MDPRDAKTTAPREPVAEPAALPWGMDKTDVQKSSFTELTDEKLARFVIGQQKKTKYEKEREEREVRKRKADAEAAAMYAKFVASFDDEDETLGKAFVRSSGSVSGESDLYRLQGTGTKKKKTISDMDRLVDEMKHNRTAPPQNKRREMDLLVEEIKSREASAPTVEEIAPLKTGSFDTGDPATTNLYVGNLAPSVTEEKLEQIFSKFGRIYSIKIMWPRSEEERSRRRMCGFVSFFTRRAAEEARTHVNDSELDGQRIVVGWSKAVKIEPGAAVFSSGGSGVQPLSVPYAVLTIPSDQPKIVVQIPSDETTRRRIDHLAAYVAKDGLAFEHAVRLREAQNPVYGFLFNTCASTAPMPDAVYYRWRVFAFAMGDTETTWRQTPFQMTMQGPVWIPPPLPSANTRLPSTRDADGLRHDRKQRKSSRSRSHNRSRSDSRDRRSRRSHSASRSPSRRGQSRSSRSSRRSHSRSKSRSRRRRSYSRSPSRSSRSSRSNSDRSNRSDRCRRSRSSSRSRGHSRSRPRSRSPRRDDDDHRQSRRRSRSRGSSRSRSPLARRSHNRSDDLHVVKKDESVLTGQQLARARDLERGREPNRLPRDAYDRFVELLHTLTLEREAIKQAMGCALDNSECAVELVHILRKRFFQEDASAVQLVAYLYVASDILHNSSAAVKNASLFRTTFQACLPEILDRLRQVHRTLQGRMSALAMRDKVLAVLTAWGSWSLFPPQYLVGLNATFLRKVDEPAGMEEGNASYGVDEEKLRKACSHAGILSSGSVGVMLARLQWLKEFTSPTTKSAAPKAKELMPVKERKSEELAIAKEVEGEDDLDGEPMDDRALGDDDLDGEPLEEDVDGEPLDPEREILDEDVNGEPLNPEIGDVDEEDLDGEPLDDEDDVDGEPLDEDLDGEPL